MSNEQKIETIEPPTFMTIDEMLQDILNHFKADSTYRPNIMALVVAIIDTRDELAAMRQDRG